MFVRRDLPSTGLVCAGLCLAFSLLALAGDRAQLYGSVQDPLGAVVPGATIELLAAERVVARAHSADDGTYHIEVPRAGRYRLRVSAPSFHRALTEARYISHSGESRIDVTLSVGALSDEITVVATGLSTPESQLGYSLTVLTGNQLPNSDEVQASLRLIPSVQLTQSGQMGATTSIFIRGGGSDASKVLIDGLPTSFVGGFSEMGILSSTGVDRIEVLRGPNSVLYGSDALSGVVSLTTRRGTTPLPELSYAVDGGNFNSYSQRASLGGAVRQWDYFSAFSVIATRNGVPDDSFHNSTYAGSFGWAPRPRTSLRLSLRDLATNAQVPNAIALYDIPDDAGRLDHQTYLSLTAEDQTSERWHNLVRYGRTRLREVYTDYAPTGIPFYDAAYGPGISWYLGAPVVLEGANGYGPVSGQAIFQYPGTYPTSTLVTTNRDFIYAQTDYRFSQHLSGLASFNYESERGSDDTVPSILTTERGNYSYSVELAGDLRSRLYYTLGGEVEDNALFGVVATPRASLAYYLLRPRDSRSFSSTKLRASFGKGIKEPSLYQQFNSLYGLLSTSEENSLIAKYGVNPVGAERSRTYDAGIDQELFEGRAKVGLTYFHNQFTDGVEYVPQQGLVELGIPSSITDSAAAEFGAYVNTLTYRAQGAEAEIEAKITSKLSARGGYSYLDPVVQHSFSSDALAPSYNPASDFANIPIGVYSPLRGERPFRLAPHTGYFGLNYEPARWILSLTGTLVSRRDDSDYLSDKYGGTTLLLPNRDLDPAYQRLDLMAGYRVNPRVEIYSSFGNILSQHYSEAFGYPALPFSFRAGIELSFGGESWKWR
jgi:iron complex outermembrane receptor protein/vitamin B12 transporter